MRQKLLASKNAIPENTGFTKQINNTGKDLLEGIELFYQVEELSNKLILKKDENVDSGLKGYYLLLNGKKVAHFNYKKYKNGNIGLSTFVTSNSRYYENIIQKDGVWFIYFSLISKLDEVEKISLLGKSSLLKFILLMKKENVKEIELYSSKFAYNKSFYDSSFDLFEKNNIIKGWSKFEKSYSVFLY